MKFFFFGDSICFGQGVSLHKGWVPKISQQLSDMAESEGFDITVINNAVNGRTTRQALETMPYDVQSHRPDLVLLQFGMNDCNYWQSDEGLQRVSPAAFKANLHEIIKRALTFGAQRVFINTNHPTTRNRDLFPFTSISYEQSNRFYNELIREVHSESCEKVILTDMERSFLDHIQRTGEQVSDLLLSDQLHLSEKGHLLYFSTIFPEIQSITLQLVDRKKVGIQ